MKSARTQVLYAQSVRDRSTIPLGKASTDEAC
jgi:hypothetical protein